MQRWHRTLGSRKMPLFGSSSRRGVYLCLCWTQPYSMKLIYFENRQWHYMSLVLLSQLRISVRCLTLEIWTHCKTFWLNLVMSVYDLYLTQRALQVVEFVQEFKKGKLAIIHWVYYSRILWNCYLLFELGFVTYHLKGKSRKVEVLVTESYSEQDYSATLAFWTEAEETNFVCNEETGYIHISRVLENFFNGGPCCGRWIY